MRWIPLLSLLLLASLLNAQELDARMPKSVVGIPIFVPFEPSTQDVIVAIAQSKDDKLMKALRWDAPPIFTLRLRYNEQIPLHGENHILCLFDSSATGGFGDGPRVLILFTEKYEIVTWSEFKGWGFQYGTIVPSATGSKDDPTLFTVNCSSRNNSLRFEKYRISPTKIEKLGQGPDLPKIPEP